MVTNKSWVPKIARQDLEKKYTYRNRLWKYCSFGLIVFLFFIMVFLALSVMDNFRSVQRASICLAFYSHILKNMNEHLDFLHLCNNQNCIDYFTTLIAYDSKKLEIVNTKCGIK